MKSPKLSFQFSWFQPHRSVITDRINTEFRRKHFIFKKQNENLEDETNNAFVKFLRLSNGTQINNQQCLFFDWYIVSIFFFSSSVGYILLVIKTLNIQPCTCKPYPAPASAIRTSFSYWQYIKLLQWTWKILSCSCYLGNISFVAAGPCRQASDSHSPSLPAGGEIDRLCRGL